MREPVSAFNGDKEAHGVSSSSGGSTQRLPPPPIPKDMVCKVAFLRVFEWERLNKLCQSHDVPYEEGCAHSFLIIHCLSLSQYHKSHSCYLKYHSHLSMTSENVHVNDQGEAIYKSLYHQRGALCGSPLCHVNLGS